MTIDLPVLSSYPGNKIQFPEIPELRSDIDKDAIIFSIQTYHASIVPDTFNGNPVATYDQLANSVVTLYVVGVEQQFNIPLPRLVNMQSNLSTEESWFSREPFFFDGQRIDWTKSYIQACTGTIAGDTSYSFYFEMEYEWMPAGSYSAHVTAQRARWLSGNFKE